MQAAVIDRYGPPEVLRVTEILRPEPRADEVLVRVAALGAHAEYVALVANKLVRKPAAVTHEDAAGVLFGGTTALFFLQEKASVGPGMSVLVNGASGAVGTNAVQLARHFGATVTAVTSKANAAWVTRLGAERVTDVERLLQFVAKGQLSVVLDQTVALSDIELAHRRVDSGRKRGNVVVLP